MNLRTINLFCATIIIFCITIGSSQNSAGPSPRFYYQSGADFYNNPFAIFLATQRPPVGTSGNNQPSAQSNKQNQNGQECSCGKKNTGNRIVGGKEANPLDYPWMVAIYAGNRFICGGTLIYRNIVLTAAHCAPWRSPGYYTVKVNVHNLSTAGGVTLGVRRIDVHPYYRESSMQNDIALMTLSSESSLMPVCLDRSNNNNDYANSIATAIGWGRLSENGQLPNGLHEVNLTAISRGQCSRVLPYIYNYSICTKERSKDACQGDSGGPLFIFDSRLQSYTQIGIISWGIGCADENYPGVYTGISNFIPWIEGTTGRNFYTCQA